MLYSVELWGHSDSLGVKCEKVKLYILYNVLNNMGVRGANPPCSWKSKYNYSQPSISTVPSHLWFHIHGFNQLWIMWYCSTYLLKKKSAYKWTCAVQTHVVQGSTVYYILCIKVHALWPEVNGGHSVFIIRQKTRLKNIVNI